MDRPAHHLRFFDDYGSGWLWAVDAEGWALWGHGPIDDQMTALLRPETCDLAQQLSDRHAQSLNQTYPPDGCQWPLPERLAFDATVERLFQMIQADLGPQFILRDERMILGAE